MAADISPLEQEVLARIYIGQNIRKEGILQSDIPAKKETQTLLSMNLIEENNWYLRQFLTTDVGSRVAKKLILERIMQTQGQLQKKISHIPKRVLGFFIARHVSKRLTFLMEKPSWSLEWEDLVLASGRIWILFDTFLKALESLGLSVRAYNYVSTRGGELRNLCYVISAEIQQSLTDRYIPFDFAPDEESTLRVFPVLMQASVILAGEDVDYVRQEFYNLLRDRSVTEKQLAAIIGETKEVGITGEYRGLFSKDKPFDIIDQKRFEMYLYENIIEPAIDVLFEQRSTLRGYVLQEEMPSLSEMKSKLGILDSQELGNFYNLVVDLEKKLREFIKWKLGRNWMKRIQSDIPVVVTNWEERRRRDENWGIDPERDIMSYADFGDYLRIIKNYGRVFSDSEDELNDAITHLKIWYNQGRNPIMHGRTVDQQRYFTAKSAVDFLLAWINRRRREGPTESKCSSQSGCLRS